MHADQSWEGCGMKQHSQPGNRHNPRLSEKINKEMKLQKKIMKQNIGPYIKN